MSNSERQVPKKIPTPTLLVTDLGVLTIAPELRKTAKDVFGAVRLGMDLDDFWDFGVSPRPQNGLPETTVEEFDTYDFYKKYFSSYSRFIDGLADKNPLERRRLSDNAGWFISSVHYLEGEAISRPHSHWNPESVRDYRESTAIVWAMFLASLNEECSVDLYKIANSKGHFSLTDCYAWMNDDTGPQLEKLYTKRLYFGALVFQVVSDYGKRDFAR